MSRTSKIIIALVALAAVALIAIKPVGVFGYDAGALASSLAGGVDSPGVAECTEIRPLAYDCLVETESSSGFGAQYRLHTNRSGCWGAHSVAYGKSPRAEPRAASGCVGLLDLLGGVD